MTRWASDMFRLAQQALERVGQSQLQGVSWDQDLQKGAGPSEWIVQALGRGDLWWGGACWPSPIWLLVTKPCG